ncbi:MAG: hypothetical protein OEY18_08995 [Candidatus Aminicenantes bacterium]|nr:hypothetical protein [Candidatus Aminicenantes bacterium]MDH5384830.1 hypothetical protein [Candidatus Aminicenantes bacterium]MDH5743749.1 hypothetical protein [Candidatus Aminicenantes bacterium]
MVSALLSAASILKERYNEVEAYTQRTLDVDIQHAQTHSNLVA